MTGHAKFLRAVAYVQFGVPFWETLDADEMGNDPNIPQSPQGSANILSIWVNRHLRRRGYDKTVSFEVLKYDFEDIEDYKHSELAKIKAQVYTGDKKESMEWKVDYHDILRSARTKFFECITGSQP